MDISGSYTLNAPPDQVWKALLDPDIAQRAIPGCESLEQTASNEYDVRMNVGVAGVKGGYEGTLQVRDTQPPGSYRLVLDGSGARGVVHADGSVQLTAQGADSTLVSYSGQAQIGGALASLGPQITTGAANMLIRRYFTQLAALLPAPVAAAAPSAVPYVAPESDAYTIPAAPTEPVEPVAPVAPVVPPYIPPISLPAEPAAGMAVAAALTPMTMASAIPTDSGVLAPIPPMPAPEPAPTPDPASDMAPEPAPESIPEPTSAAVPEPARPVEAPTPFPNAYAQVAPTSQEASDAGASRRGVVLTVALIVVVLVLIVAAIWYITH